MHRTLEITPRNKFHRQSHHLLADLIHFAVETAVRTRLLGDAMPLPRQEQLGVQRGSQIQTRNKKQLAVSGSALMSTIQSAGFL